MLLYCISSLCGGPTRRMSASKPLKMLFLDANTLFFNISHRSDPSVLNRLNAQLLKSIQMLIHRFKLFFGMTFPIPDLTRNT